VPIEYTREPSRVLVIDDDELISDTLFRHLVSRGVQADVAIDAAAAEDLLAAHDYAVVLMDAYLSGQLHARATALVDRVRLLRPGSHIVVLTAYLSEQLAETVAKHARVTVVAKPKSISYLARVIDDLLAPA
jgi:DNA-binding NtrC family response regulator